MNAIFLKFNIYDRNLKIFFHSSKPYSMSCYCRLDFRVPRPHISHVWSSPWVTERKLEQILTKVRNEEGNPTEAWQIWQAVLEKGKREEVCRQNEEPFKGEKLLQLEQRGTHREGVKLKELKGRPLRSSGSPAKFMWNLCCWWPPKTPCQTLRLA